MLCVCTMAVHICNEMSNNIGISKLIASLSVYILIIEIFLEINLVFF